MVEYKREQYFKCLSSSPYLELQFSANSIFLPAAKPRRSMGHDWPPGKIGSLLAVRGQEGMAT